MAWYLSMHAFKPCRPNHTPHPVEDLALLGAAARGLPGGGRRHGLVRVHEAQVAGAAVARVRALQAAAAGEVVAERQRVLHPLQQPGRGREWHHLRAGANIAKLYTILNSFQ